MTALCSMIVAASLCADGKETNPRLWHGLLTVPPQSTEGLLHPRGQETFGRGSVARSGDRATTLGLCADGKETNFGYLPAQGGKERRLVRYEPREGDLIFFDDHHPIWTALFAWAGTGPPLHMGIVVKKADHSFAVLEAGPDDTVWVTLQDLSTRLAQFDRDFHGTISIRRCKKVLPRETSWALTRFAYMQDGKPYAVARLLLQGTSLRSRGPVRELFLGSTQLDRWSWICSELAVAAGTTAELFPPGVKANATYPKDLVDNVRHDLSNNWHDAAIWSKKGPE